MHEFVAKKGLISQGNSQVTGSLKVSSGIYGRLYDTASYAEKVKSVVTNLIDAPNIITPCESGSYFRIVLGGDRILSNPSNAEDGQRLVYQIIQDSAGGRTLAFGNKFRGDLNNIVLSSGPNSVDFIGVICDTIRDEYYVTVSDICLLYTSPSPRGRTRSRMPSSA